MIPVRMQEKKRLEHTAKGLLTRTKILRAALKIFSQKGFDNASIREIAEISGTTLPSLYYYFGSKETLLKELINEERSALQANPEGHRKHRNSLEKLMAVCLAHYNTMKKHVPFLRIMRSLHLKNPETEFLSDSVTYRETFYHVVTGIIKNGIGTGEIRQGATTEMALIICSILSTAGDHLCYNLYCDLDETRLKQMLRLVLDSYSARD